jgi:hypothetical protein
LWPEFANSFFGNGTGLEYFCDMMRILLLLISQASWAAPIVVKDLRAGWMTHAENTYRLMGLTPAMDVQTIYFDLNAAAFKGQYLSIVSRDTWDLFVNGKLIDSGQQRLLSIDSLSLLYSPSLFLGIQSNEGIYTLITQVVSPQASVGATARTILARPPTFFRDYAILVSFFLLFFLLILYRTNAQLTLDYFSFAKIFSVQERNENLLASRITSSVNMLFYLFCALLTGFLLSAVFYFADAYFSVAKFTVIDSLGSAFIVWLKLSLLILSLLASKLVIVLLFSSLFNFRDTVSFQFFNFLRFVLFTAVMMSVLSLLYFAIKGGQALFYRQLIIMALVLLSAGSVMVLIKLLARAPFSLFHLFSYLCASEIIPLVIIIKIFF